MNFYHVDVFANQPLNGNGLSVVFIEKQLSDQTLQNIACEFNQFETIFIYPEEDSIFPARIFTVEEELDFAGHPILGAAAVILAKTNSSQKEIKFIIKKRIITTNAVKENSSYSVMMNQGKAEFINTLTISEIETIIKSLNLSTHDIPDNYPIEVVSTGLSYLLLPVKNMEALGKSKITVSNMEKLLLDTGAKFLYLFNPDTLVCRTWDNLGKVEDAATGSAAGPLCAYLVKNGYKQKDEIIKIRQGQFINRPGIIESWIDSESENVMIKGNVSFFSKGKIMI